MRRVDLSREQADAADALCEWARWTSGARGLAGAYGPEDERVRALRGLAGTGKTTVAAEVARRLAADGTRVAVVAPTGKAAHVLRGKGVPATTIHAAAYELVADGPDGPEFRLRAGITGDPDVVVCDEASMATREHLDDLLARVPRVLLVGDPGQLPPVSGVAVLGDALGVDLEEVHRQALDSGVVRFAHAIRRGASITEAARVGAPDVVLGRPRTLPGAVLVARNDVRVQTNRGLRLQVHAPRRARDGGGPLPPWPIVGDRVVCLSNHRRVPGAGDPWCNGTVGDVVRTPDRKGDAHADAICEFIAACDDGSDRAGAAWLRQLSAPDLLAAEPHDRRRRDSRFAWGWCLTVHKAQGSEWDDVLVLGDGFGTPDEIRAWRYTAATRAARRLWWSV